MGSKKRNKAIKALGNNLPLVMQQTQEKHFVKGNELIEQGQTHIGDDKVIAEMDYLQRMPVHIAFNHSRRLKRAFKKHGADGIKQYLSNLTNITKKHIDENKAN